MFGEGAPPWPAGKPQRPSRSTARNRFNTILGELRERICLLHYPPGTRLSETALAEEFGVSRTPMRRVLNRLEFEGLVESQQGVGTIVTTIDLPAFTDVFILRMRLAELMGDLSPVPPGEADIAALRRLLVRCKRLRRERDPLEFARINMAFTLELTRRIGNEALREMSEQLYFRTARIWLALVPEMDWELEVGTFAREIADIIDAMRAGDMRAVGLIRRNHIAMSLRRLTHHVQSAQTQVS